MLCPWVRSSRLCLRESFGNPPPCLLRCTGSSSSFKPRPLSPLLHMQPTFSRLRAGLPCVTRPITECGSPNPSHSAPRPCTPGPRAYGVEISNTWSRGSPEPPVLSPSHSVSAAPTDPRPGLRLLASALGLGPAHCLVRQTKLSRPQSGLHLALPSHMPLEARPRNFLRPGLRAAVESGKARRLQSPVRISGQLQARLGFRPGKPGAAGQGLATAMGHGRRRSPSSEG